MNKKIILLIIQMLLLSNIAWAQQDTMLSPRASLDVNQIQYIFNAEKVSDPSVFDYMGYFSPPFKNKIDDILDSGFKDFGRKQEYYYKTYMQMRAVIYDFGIADNTVLNYLRYLSANTEDLFRRKMYLMVWAKLMEDYIADNIVNNDKISMPRYLTLCLTERCNAKCRFCLAKVNPEHKEKLSISQIKKILLDAKASGVEEIRFMGGELSLVRNELLETIRMAKSLGMRTGLMFTNGWWIDERWAEDFMIEFAAAEQKKSPTFMLSVDTVHQQHIPLEKIGRFIDKYFTLFPGGTLYLHTYVTSQDDELDDFVKFLGGNIVQDEENLLPGGIKLRTIKLKKGALKVLYANLLQMGDAENLPQDLYDKFVLKNSGDYREDEHYRKLKFTPSVSSVRLDNSLTISARGEYFLGSIYIPDSVFSMGNVNSKSIKDSMRYIRKNMVIKTFFKENGQILLYEKAKEFVPNLSKSISKCNYLEEALVRMLRDPIARLAINVRLLETEQVDSLNMQGLLSKDKIDLEYILKIAKENKDFLHAVDNLEYKQTPEDNPLLLFKPLNKNRASKVHFAERSI
ncbi:MAG: radical SAM protein [Candidatus Omnitrophica bacterium]|nr:radical SAM protein [Candidatus Omnitrophota bacterium]